MNASESLNKTSNELIKGNVSQYTYERPWLRDEIFATTLTVISLYLVIALSIFEVRKSKSKSVHETPIIKKTWIKRIEDFCSKGSLCLVAAVFALVRCLCEQIELRLGQTSDLACRIYQHELVEVFHISLTCLYLLLWVRQLKMYRHQALRHLSSPLLRFVSMMVIVGILGSSFATAISYLVGFTLISSPHGCVYDLSNFSAASSSTIPGLLLFIIAFVFQFSLLLLLVYPLLKHYKIRFCCCSKVNNRSNENVRRTIVRLSVCTTICVLSDLVASNVLMFLHDGVTPIMFWANIYTTNLIINIITVTRSFVDWKRRLFPCARFHQEVAQGATHTSSSLL